MVVECCLSVPDGHDRAKSRQSITYRIFLNDGGSMSKGYIASELETIIILLVNGFDEGMVYFFNVVDYNVGDNLKRRGRPC